ncbi:hypothetical protein [Streptomyces scabiei]|uniref:hypothetical protein n=1 Tax=Streptomyces scabiei TaxID=1930 RepID=UPI0029A482F6|nr:hypothetical protein [Streptomyces scabiei]MDX3277308.1 hypothetical protein [Streptomyces scabiei]
MEWLGLFWIVVFLGTPLLIGGLLGKKFGPAQQRRRRKREVEAAMTRYSYDADLFDEVLDDMRHDRRSRRRY